MSRKHRRAIAWLLVAVMSFSPSLVYAQAAETAASAAVPVPKPKLDLSYVTPETAAIVVAFPRHVLTAPEMEMLPVEVFTAAGLKELGIDPAQIEQILAVVEPPQAGAMLAAVVVEMASPLGQEKLWRPCSRGRWKTNWTASRTAAGRIRWRPAFSAPTSARCLWERTRWFANWSPATPPRSKAR